jgi:ABC-type transport system substrate-binding protein
MSRGTAIVLCVALVGACSGGGGGDGKGSPKPLAQGGTLRIGVHAPESYDPAKLSPAAPGDLMIADLLYDSLTQRGDDGVVAPSIASAWTSKNLVTWRFTLAKRTFADGKPLTATDVKASLEHVATVAKDSFAAARLDVIKGFDQLAAGKAKDLRGLRAVDASTLDVTLNQPVSTLPDILSSPLFGIVRVAALAAKQPADGPVASGSFEASAATRDGVHLAPRADAGVALDAIDLRYFKDDAAAYKAFTNGDIDVAPVPAAAYDDAVDEYGDGAIVPFQAELFFAMNLKSPTFQDAAFRRAIAAAIDRDAVVSKAYGGRAQPLATLVPAGVTGHDPAACAKLCDANVTRAKLQLREAKDKTAKVFVDVDDTEPQTAMAKVVVANLKAVGIKATGRGHKFKDYLSFAIKGEQSLFVFGWVGMYDSPDAYLNALFTSEGRDNVTGIESDTINDLLKAARKSRVAADRAKAWRLAERKILEGAFIVPIAQFRVQLVVADNVKGFTPRTDATFDPTAVSLE